MDDLSFGEQLIELLKSSVLVQAIIALAVLVSVLIMGVRGMPVPDWMLQIVWLVLGFYFGSKIGYSQGMRNQEPPITYVETTDTLGAHHDD